MEDKKANTDHKAPNSIIGNTDDATIKVNANNMGTDTLYLGELTNFDMDNSFDEFPEYTTPGLDLASTPIININTG